MPKILIVEDDATMITLLKTLLTLEGFETLIFNPGDDVVHLVQSEHPDLVLMDVNLAGANGMDVLKKIREAESGNHTVVLMSSGMPMETESLAAGADGFILKPYMPVDLVDSIKNLISKGR